MTVKGAVQKRWVQPSREKELACLLVTVTVKFREADALSQGDA